MNQEGAIKKMKMEDSLVSMSTVAAAFNKTEDEFAAILVPLVALGFPIPAGEKKQYSATDILDWIASQQEHHVALLHAIKLGLVN